VVASLSFLERLGERHASSDITEMRYLKKAVTKKKTRSKALKYDYVEVTVSQCRKCKSTDRGHYFKRQVFVIEGRNRVTGEPYNMIVNRFCKCAACNQARIDKHFLNVADLRKMLEKGKSKEDVADAAKLKLGRPRNNL
jgi:hypothetical protein